MRDSGISRRQAMGVMVAGLASCRWWGPSEPSPTQVEALATELSALGGPEVGAWLRATLDRGIPPHQVLDGANLAAVRRCSDQGDLHHLLTSGPILRLGATPRLLLWQLLHLVDWLEYAVCTQPVESGPSGSVEALVRATLRPHVDPHPTIYASEVVAAWQRLAPPHRDELASSVRTRLPTEGAGPGATELRVLALADVDGKADVPMDVATLVHAGGGEAVLEGLERLGPSNESLWAGLAIAGAAAWHGIGGSVNATHATTLVSAYRRMATHPSVADDATLPRALAITAALRLATDGPSVDHPAALKQAGKDLGIEAWKAAARSTGPDPHHLKFCEAVAHGDPHPLVRRLVAGAHFLKPDPGWPRLDEAMAAFDRGIP